MCGACSHYLSSSRRPQRPRLQAPPPVTGPWTCPGCHNEEDSLQATELRRLAQTDAAEPQHCGATKRVCEGSAAVTERQKRQITSLAHALPLPGGGERRAPEWTELDFAGAEAWIERHQRQWMEQPAAEKLTLDEFMRHTAPARR